MVRITSSNEEPKKRRPAAITPEQRNNQLIAKSYDAAEDMINSGRATSQLLVHFLKQGTARDELERTKLIHETQVLEKRAAQMAASEDVRELYQEVISAVTTYKGDSFDTV